MSYMDQCLTKNNLMDINELPQGRVKTVTVNHKGICLTHFKGKFSALDKKYPNQGGWLGEGAIKNNFYDLLHTIGISSSLQEKLLV